MHYAIKQIPRSGLLSVCNKKTKQGGHGFEPPKSVRLDVLFGTCLFLKLILLYSITLKSMIVIIDRGIGYYPSEVSKYNLIS